MSAIDLDKLALQLKCPVGNEGKVLGKLMNASNKGMITNSLLAMSVKNKHRILEIGPGNGEHLTDIMRLANGLRYFGFEISKTMTEEAVRINKKYVKSGRALFQHYNGNKIPYVLNFFDRIITVNTIYFWEKPDVFLKEINRVLKPKGHFVLTFVDKKCMEGLPFVNSVFSLFNIDKVSQLAMDSGFEIIDIKTKTEYVRSKTDDLVHRKYTIMTLGKKTISHQRNT
ncbi:class I SAM-dependent methyltransferase [Aquimarina addita]|uniref:Class I SAM-dependent methyltransferase n=1 Tax=Aquimarina addita TaxID=870485 RepID=A0ABP6URL0_9FLAO